jgi:glycosyltransferase involved in cell wall biosynthesis
MQHSEQASFIQENATPAEKLRALNDSTIILGMRLHAVIFAIKQSIPVVALAYDPKVSNLMRAVHKPGLCVELDSANADAIFSSLVTAYEGRHTTRADFNHLKVGFSVLAQENAAIARAVIFGDHAGKPPYSPESIETIKALLLEHALRSQAALRTNLNQQQEIEKWVDYSKLREEEFQALHKALSAQIQDLSTHIQNLSAQNQALSVQQDLLLSNLQAREEVIHDLNGQIALMKTSFSWKITRPIRVLARLIRNRGISAQDRTTIAVKLEDYLKERSLPSWLERFLNKRFPLPAPEAEITPPPPLTTVMPPTPLISKTTALSPTAVKAEYNQVSNHGKTMPYWGVRSPHGKRRVAMLTNMLLDWQDGRPRYGGGERYALELATLFQDLGISPTFYQPSAQGFGKGEYFNFQVNTFPLGEHFGEFNHSGCSYFTEQTKDYDHVYHHLPEYASCRVREDSLMTCHGIWFDHEHNAPVVRSPQWFNHLYHAFANPQAVVSVDTHSISVMRSLWPDVAKHMHYIPNFFDGGTIFPDPSKRDPNKLTIIFPRRSYVLRGSRIFPEIVANIPHDVDIFWIGEGDPEDTQIIKDVCKQDQRVNFIVADFAEMPAWYQRADIVVIPTLGSEGTSLSCLEALASGCATIATNIGGLNDLILNDYNGYIVEPNAYEITQAINLLIENKQERRRLQELAPHSVQFFERRYWRDKWAQLILSLGWINEAAYQGWKKKTRQDGDREIYPAVKIPQEKWVILTRNAIHGGVESLIYQEARILDAPVIVCGGHEQPQTCPFDYTRADDAAALTQALQPFDVILYHYLPEWAVRVVAQSGKASLEFVHRTDTSDSDKQVPTGLVTHSAFLAEYIYQEFGRLSRVVDHPIDADRLTPPAEKGPYIGAVTSYYETKGIDLFLRAWAQLQDEFPHIPVRFYGSGEDQAKFEQLAQDLGVAAEFCPPTTKVWEALADYRLFVVPSRIEGFPVAILEALAMNIPVIASDLAGVTEFNTRAEQHGYPPLITTVRTEDVEDLVAVLRSTLQRDSFPASREFIQTFYNPQTHCDNIQTALREFRQMNPAL